MTTNGAAANGARPVIALAMGDPAGISPELTARLLALPDIKEAAHIITIGDRRILDEGAKAAGLTLDLELDARGSRQGWNEPPRFRRPRPSRSGGCRSRRSDACWRHVCHAQLPHRAGVGACRQG